VSTALSLSSEGVIAPPGHPRDTRLRPVRTAAIVGAGTANVMKLFKVVKGAKSAPDTLVTAMDLGRKIGKISAMAGNGDGFVANEQIDKVMVDFGYPIRPFATADLSHLDIGYDSRQRRAAQDPNYRKMPIADMVVETGRLGQKTGAGWFKYERIAKR
jgi:3-hydroxyacyl-CoA dehydrogenase